MSLSQNDGRQVMATFGPGLVSTVGIASVSTIGVGEQVELDSERPLVLALDGEREIVLYEGDTASVALRADGPWIIDASRTLRQMADRRLFDR